MAFRRCPFPAVVFGSLTLIAVPAFAQSTTPPAKPGAPAKVAGPGPHSTPTGPKPAAPATTTPAATAPSTTAPEATKVEPAKPEAEADEKEDVNAIYLSGELGFTRADVGGFSDSTGLDKTGANGLLAGLGLGYRRDQFRFGVRFRDHSTSEFALWAFMGEIGYALKMRPLSPAFYIHAGYMFDNSVDRSAFEKKLPLGNFQTPDIDFNGVVVGGEVVASFHLSHVARVGPFIGFDVTVLHRPQPGPPQSIVPVPPAVLTNPLFGEAGNGLGYVFNLGVRFTADIGFDAAFKKNEPAPPPPAK